MLQRLVRFSRTLLLIGSTLALGLGFPGDAHAQQGTTTGSIAGVVTDPAGEPLEDVVVRVVNIAQGTERQVLTGAGGQYTVPLLASGQYRVRAELPPLNPVEVGPIQVSIGQRSQVNITLQPVEGEALDITVGAGGAQQIDIGQGGVVEEVDEQQISELPTAGRDFTDFINLSALVSPQPGIGTGGQFSIGGARTSGTNITIDGADSNNAFFGENRGSSRAPFAFSLESIKEFQIITNGYDVEYGRFQGGQINAVTKSGSNQFSGEAWFFGRDEALTIENFDGSDPTDFTSYQFGGRFSGPIIEDKLHFFVSGDFQDRDQPAFALTPSRSDIPQSTLDDFQSILTDVYGFSQEKVADNFGQFEETDDQANLFGRLDWTVNPDHRLSVRVNYSDFENTNDRIDPAGTEARTLGSTFNNEVISVVGEWNSTLSPNVFNTLRFQYSDEERPRPSNSTLPTLQVSGVETRDGRSTSMFFGGEFFGITFANRLEEEKFQITDNLNVNLGDHSLKIGGDWIHTDTFNRFWLNGNGWFLFRNLEEFRTQDPLFFLRFVPDLENPTAPTADFTTDEFAAYLQDDWQATDRLRVQAGLRWDFQDFNDPGPPLENPTFQEAVTNFDVGPTELDATGSPLGPGVLPDDKNNFGPRLSMTYDLRGDESEIIRAGAGLFYGRTPTVTHSNVLLTTPEPTLAIFCLAGATPDLGNLPQYEENSAQSIPSDCKFRGFQFNPEFDPIPIGIGDVGDPEIAVWDPDIDNSRTVKANLGYEREVTNRWKVGAQALFTRTWGMFGAIDANLDTDITDDSGFRSADGRPVFIGGPEDFDPRDTDAGDAPRDEELRRLFVHTDNGDFRAFNLKFDVTGAPTENLRVAANYAFNRAYDNNSTECCTANALTFDTPTAGNPNELGDPGDDEVGAWGPARVSRKHVFVLNGIWSLPAGFQFSAIYRAQAGNPYTPEVEGDLNGDGDDGNDRPFLPDPATAAAGEPLNLDGLQFSSQEDLDAYRQFLEENSCLREHVGQIIPRNQCSDPWFHSVDLKIKKSFQFLGRQGFEVIADLFNVLDGLGIDGGEFVFESREIFEVDSDNPENGFDAEEREPIVRTADFGREIPVGFQPFQFQAQLGVRYTF